LENLKNYKKQIGKIIDLKKAEFHFNSKWLNKLGFSEISKLTESFTVQQMLARRNFKDRYENGGEISIREFMYPLMQGYDSVMVNADIEIGGFDQLFNLKAGRIIQRYYGQKEQDVLTIQMLEGTNGRKMSTSWGNVINIIDEPKDMYGKIMSMKDELIEKYFLLTTDVPLVKIQEIHDRLEQGGNPKEEKMLLARTIVAMYHGEDNAVDAEKSFVSVFSNKEIPDDLPELNIIESADIAGVLVESGYVSSKTEWRRLVGQGGISEMNSKAVVGLEYKPKSGDILKIGKKRFVKIVF